MPWKPSARPVTRYWQVKIERVPSWDALPGAFYRRRGAEGSARALRPAKGTLVAERPCIRDTAATAISGVPCRTPLGLDQVSKCLASYVRATCGEHFSVEHLEVMEAGHAGLTFGFDLVNEGLSPPRGLVLKLAPQGVRRAGNTDVYRQAPLLRALSSAGMPVPAVPFAEQDDAWFGAPFIVMERLVGEPFFVAAGVFFRSLERRRCSAMGADPRRDDRSSSF